MIINIFFAIIGIFVIRHVLTDNIRQYINYKAVLFLLLIHGLLRVLPIYIDYTNLGWLIGGILGLAISSLIVSSLMAIVKTYRSEILTNFYYGMFTGLLVTTIRDFTSLGSLL